MPVQLVEQPSASGSWVDGFMDYTSGLPSPSIFRRWSALTCISGALERRCWTRVSNSVLYPNMFVLLVGPPGVGKGMAINEVHDLWATTGAFNVSPTSLTKAAFIDQLCCKVKLLEVGGKVAAYNSILIPAPEFGTLVVAHDMAFLNTLNDIYDCRSIYEERTRSGGLVHIDRPHIVILGGTQPKYLGDLLPESAYGQGFTARIIMIYAGDPVKVSLFGETTKSEARKKMLVKELSGIAGMAGEFKWTKAAQDAIEKWNEERELDEPRHPRLVYYNTRRIIHAIKLSMILSASRTRELKVEEEDVLESKKILLSAEGVMPEIFKEMTASSDMNEINEAFEFIWTYCFREEKKAVEEHKLVHFLSQRVPVHRISFFIEAMLNGNMMKNVGLNIVGNRKFEPQERIME